PDPTSTRATPPSPSPLSLPDALPISAGAPRECGGGQYRDGEPRRRRGQYAQDGGTRHHLSRGASAPVGNLAAVRNVCDTDRISRSEEHTSELQSPDHLV